MLKNIVTTYENAKKNFYFHESSNIYDRAFCAQEREDPLLNNFFRFAFLISMHQMQQALHAVEPLKNF